MTYIIIINSILGLAVVSAIAGGHLWAIISSRPATRPAPAPVAAPRLAGTLAPEPAMA